MGILNVPNSFFKVCGSRNYPLFPYKWTGETGLELRLPIRLYISNRGTKYRMIPQKQKQKQKQQPVFAQQTVMCC